MKRPTFVRRSWRGFALALYSALPAFMLVVSIGMMRSTVNAVRDHPEIAELRACLDRLTEIESADTPMGPEATVEREAIEIYVAGRFRELVRGDGDASFFVASEFDPSALVLAERIFEERGEVEEKQVRRAAADLAPLLASAPPEEAWGVWDVATGVLAGCIVVGIFASVCAFAFRGGLMMRLTGIAVVTQDGADASRLRALGRVLVAWAPILGSAWMPILWWDPSSWGPGAWVLLGIVAFAGGAAWSLVKPQRGPQDLVAGTYLVPQ